MFIFDPKSTKGHVFFSVIALGLLVSPPLKAQKLDHQVQYQACMSLVETDPEGAFDSGLAWQTLGGGEAAEHCIASALIKMGQYKSGAKRLEVLAENSRRPKEFKAQILSQAATAWTLQNDLGQARAVLTTAIELDENNPHLYVERAQILAEENALQATIDDLNQAIIIDKNFADAFALRGSAFRLLEKFMEASSNINQALTLNPRHPEALLERGMLFRIEGNDEDARKDWLAVLQIEGDGPLAEVARRNLEKMDVKSE